MKVRTEGYEIHHGRKPRGKAYFGFDVTYKRHDGWHNEIAWEYGTISTAAKLVIERFKEAYGKIEVLEIAVMP